MITYNSFNLYFISIVRSRTKIIRIYKQINYKSLWPCPVPATRVFKYPSLWFCSMLIHMAICVFHLYRSECNLSNGGGGSTIIKNFLSSSKILPAYNLIKPRGSALENQRGCNDKRGCTSNMGWRTSASRRMMSVLGFLA